MSKRCSEKEKIRLVSGYVESGESRASYAKLHGVSVGGRMIRLIWITVPPNIIASIGDVLFALFQFLLHLSVLFLKQCTTPARYHLDEDVTVEAVVPVGDHGSELCGLLACAPQATRELR
jgi:hypothetical protein